MRSFTHTTILFLLPLVIYDIITNIVIYTEAVGVRGTIEHSSRRGLSPTDSPRNRSKSMKGHSEDKRYDTASDRKDKLSTKENKKKGQTSSILIDSNTGRLTGSQSKGKNGKAAKGGKRGKSGSAVPSGGVTQDDKGYSFAKQASVIEMDGNLCIPFTETIIKTKLADESCRTNSCLGGCCRDYNYLVCDENNDYPYLKCVCNANTKNDHLEIDTSVGANLTPGNNNVNIASLTYPLTSPPTNPPTSPPTNPQTSPPTNPPTSPPTNPPTSPPTNPPTLSPKKIPTQPPV